MESLLLRLYVMALLPFRCAISIRRSAVCGYSYSLQLCDSTTDISYGSVRCARGGTSYCKGAATGTTNANNCNPNDFWAGVCADSSSCYEAYLNNGTMYTQSTPYTRAFSVRCLVLYPSMWRCVDIILLTTDC